MHNSVVTPDNNMCNSSKCSYDYQLSKMMQFKEHAEVEKPWQQFSWQHVTSDKN